MEDSYNAETGYFLVNVQAKIPSGKGVSSLVVTLSYDNNALTLVHKAKDTEYAGTKNTTQTVKAEIFLVSKNEAVTVQAYDIYLTYEGLA